MLRIDQLQKTLTALLLSKSDLILYGNKSSGKTYLAHKILDSVLGKGNYISIKCIFVSDRNSLLYLIAHELVRVLKNLNSEFMDFANQWDIGQYSSLEMWIRNVNRHIKGKEELFRKIPKLYIFLDNMEEYHISEAFLKEFYFGMKNQIRCLKFSFFFCGVSLISPLLGIYEPSRLIPLFVMPKPNINGIVEAVINNSELAKKAEKNPHFKRLLNHVDKTLVSAFESIQYEIERIWLLSKSFLIEVNEYCGTNPELAKLWVDKNRNQETELLQKLKEFGAVTLQRTNNEVVKKTLGHSEVEEGQATFYMENYPSLLTTSLGLANGFSETEDIKRFVDMKKSKSARQKANMKRKQNADYTFKFDHKKVKHPKQRIMAISETLEQQATGQRLKQKDLPHHSLDYYGCFQYIREEGCVNFYGKNSKFGGIITGNPKESEVKDFLIKLNLDYFQFTGRN